MAERKFAIRFSVEDMEKVRAALKGMGEDGASALRAIERQSRQATPALRAVDVAAKDVRATFDAFALRIPVIGGALQALGPAGTIAAVGLLALGAGFNAIVRGARDAVEEVGKIKDSADNVALSIRDFQAVRGAAMLEGIDAQSLEGMLGALAINSARASEGFGKMKTALDKVNPELGRQLELSGTQAQRLDILARAVQGATSYNEKLNIAVAAFGPEGRQMVRVLEESGASMDTWRGKAMQAGLVLDELLVRDADDLGKRLDLLDAQMATAAQRFGVSAGPLLESIKKMQTDLLLGAAELADGLKPIEERQYYTLAVQWNRLKDDIRSYGDEFGVKAAALKVFEDELRKRDRIFAAQEAEDAQRTRNRAGTAELQGWFDAQLAEQLPDAIAKRKAEAARQAEEIARARAQQEREAIEVRASLGDWTGKLAAEEERLNTLVKSGFLTRDQANAALAKTRGELDGSAAAIDRWRAAAQSLETPVQRAWRELQEFIAASGDIKVPEALPAYVRAFEDAKQAAAEATPEFKAVADARAKITAEAERLMSVQDKVAAYEEKQRQLIGVNGYTWGEAMKAVAAYRAELERASQSQRDNTFELRFSAEVLTGIIDENINSLEDLGKVALRVFRQMAVEWILANQKMAAGQGLFEWIGNALTSAFTGGGASTTPTGRTGNAGAKVHHDGRVIGATAVPTRWVNSDIFFGAPRAHTGLETLRPGERPIIAEDGERMLSRVDNARVVRAIEAGAGGGPRVELHFHGAEGKPEVKETRGSDGSIRLDVMMRKAALDALSSTDGAKVMAAHYGIDRAVRT